MLCRSRCHVVRVALDAFETKYAASSDPWNYQTSSYELSKYHATIDNLPARPFSRGFEPACSIGVLSRLLAPHVDQLVACDASATAIHIATTHPQVPANVEFFQATLPDDWPLGSFDLVVFSELGYYWDEAGLHEVLIRLEQSLADRHVLMAVHWTGISDDHLLNGHRVHQLLEERFGPPTFHADHVDDDDHRYVMDRWDR
jgi:Nodulation protein S (NodS)